MHDAEFSRSHGGRETGPHVAHPMTWPLMMCIFNICIYVTMSAMKSAARLTGRGRPRNPDRPKLFSTTLPTSVYTLLVDLADLQHRTKSEILADALKAYARRFEKLF